MEFGDIGCGRRRRPRERACPQAARALAAQGIRIHFLPSYAQELNDFDQIFSIANHKEMPIRSQDTDRELTRANHSSFRNISRLTFSTVRRLGKSITGSSATCSVHEAKPFTIAFWGSIHPCSLGRKIKQFLEDSNRANPCLRTRRMTWEFGYSPPAIVNFPLT